MTEQQQASSLWYRRRGHTIETYQDDKRINSHRYPSINAAKKESRQLQLHAVDEHGKKIGRLGNGVVTLTDYPPRRRTTLRLTLEKMKQELRQKKHSKKTRTKLRKPNRRPEQPGLGL